MPIKQKMFPLTKPYLRALGMRTWHELAEKDFVRNATSNDKIVLKFDWNIKFQGKITSGTAECFINRGDLLINLAKERYNAKKMKKSIIGKASSNGI